MGTIAFIGACASLGATIFAALGTLVGAGVGAHLAKKRGEEGYED